MRRAPRWIANPSSRRCSTSERRVTTRQRTRACGLVREETLAEDVRREGGRGGGVQGSTARGDGGQRPEMRDELTASARGVREDKFE